MKRKIVIDSIILKFLQNSEITRLEDSSTIVYGKKPSENVEDYYFLSWGVDAIGVKKGIVETGFFKNAVHIDTIGLYENCSLNHYSTRNVIEQYYAPISAIEMFQSGKILPKITQTNNTPISWDGVVLAGQYQKDRSILKVGTTSDYRKFLENACKYYGKRLFVKIHPIIMGDVAEVQWTTDTAKKYGCEVGNVDISIINSAEHVITYNSTIAVDCLLRDKHVMQYAPGYFWQTGVVQYISGKLNNKIKETDKLYNQKFLNFLMWRYCFDKDSSVENLKSILLNYSSSTDMFPLLESQSYGASISKISDLNKHHLGGHNNVTHTDVGSFGYIKRTFNISSVLDIGCGPMGMKPVADSFGIKYLGIDGDISIKKDKNFVLHDYSVGPYVPAEKCDLAWSVEFLEHVEEKYIPNFMESFKRCRYACITHALPGKIGHHHVNCQPQEYWKNVFSEYGFEYSEFHTDQIRKFSSMKREFMKNTGMLFVNKNF